jgi:hypothetical protein
VRCAPRSFTLNHCELERDPQLTHHAQEPSIGFLPRNPIKKSPLGTVIFFRSTQRNIPTIFTHAGKLSCNIHGHHNRNHCIIIPLNTRTFDNYSSRLASLPGSDNPLPKTQTNSRECSHIHKNQYACPDAPKPIHPDKELFCSSPTTRLGATSSFPISDLRRNDNQKTETRFSP